MARKLPLSLRSELEWAIGVVGEHGQSSPDNMDMIRRAIRAESPMLPKRFSLFVDNAHPMQLQREDSSRIGALILALEAHAQDRPWRLYQPGEFDSGTEGRKTELLQVRVPESFKLRLRAYCERTGQEMSQMVRDAVEVYLQDQPLWQGLTTSEDDKMTAEETAR